MSAVVNGHDVRPIKTIFLRKKQAYESSIDVQQMKRVVVDVADDNVSVLVALDVTWVKGLVEGAFRRSLVEELNLSVAVQNHHVLSFDI